jgi:hypothetical protein
MFIPLPISLAWTYTVTVSGAVDKTVRCESCHAEYVYRLERTATGSGTSRVLCFYKEEATEHAAAVAQYQLRRELHEGIDLVPCPACGWYQSNMIMKGREQHCAWMWLLGVLLTAGLLPLAMLGVLINCFRCPYSPPNIPGDVMLAGLVILGLVGVSLFIARSILASRYDPNSDDPEARIQLGRSRAMLRDEFDRQAHLSKHKGDLNTQRRAEVEKRGRESDWSHTGLNNP